MDVDETKLFIANDVLRTAQELQRTITIAPPDMAKEIAQNALDILGDPKETYRMNRVALRTASAFVLNRGLTIEEQVYDGLQFGEMDVKGHFSTVRYVHIGRALNSLCLDLFDVTVLRPVEPDDPDEGQLDMPLLVPVFAVDNIWALN
ncbi:MAG TPA: hypothetical protein VLF39_03895 [Candidatus Saccharimonadales bacterium]|nr:hypothetical protein [Candidatus Saccharimonadales bacterium]